MKITVLAVGKIRERYLQDAIEEYRKRLSKYCKLEIIEVADEKVPEQAGLAMEDMIRNKEAERLLKYIKSDAYVITLEIQGKMLTSEEKMTFPHPLMRVILLEQVYRSYRIMKGEPYHK